MAEAATIMDTGGDAPPADPGSAPPASTPPIALAGGTEASAAQIGTAPEGGSDAPPAAFGEGWREALAGGDAKALKELQRYSSPDALYKSWKESRAKLSSGQYKTALPDNATEEEVSQWRAENGIPASAEDYKVDLGDGIALGDDDKPLVDDFLKHAHASGLPESAVNAALKWYVQVNENIQEQQHQQDAEYNQTSLKSLRESWGPDFKGNLGAIQTLVGDMGDYLFSARGPDGRLLGDNPQFLDMLATTARQVYPGITVIPGGGMSNVATVDEELGNIRKMMGNPASDYWKGPKAEGLQKRYRDLLEARDRLAKRG